MSLGCETPRWAQFHGDAQSQGNLATNTNPTFIAKWPAPVNVGPISYASPVIAPDGSIVIGSTNGTLSAVKPDGSGIKWTYDTGVHFGKPAIVSSAAVTDGGDVYVVSSGAGEPGTTDSPYYVSALIHLGPDGAFKCVNGNIGQGVAYELYPPGRYLFTTASPKVLEVGGETFVFLSVSRWVMVFDDQCQEVTRFELHCTGDLRTPSPFDIDFDVFRSYPEDQQGPHIFDHSFDPMQGRNWLTPTIAVATEVDRDELTLPMVVVGINACGVFGLEWQGRPTPALVQKWTKPALTTTWLSSPAISTSGQVVVGTSDGLVWSYNLQTGKDNWFFRTNEPVLATPAFYWGSLYVYVVALHTAFQLDGNGSPTPVATVTLSAKSASSPAVAWDRVFLSTQQRLYSYRSIDLTMPQEGGRVGNGGMSSPALDKDGTVYSATSAGVEAFRGR